MPHGGTYIPTLPSDSGRPYDPYDRHRTPSRTGPPRPSTAVEEDADRPPSEIARQVPPPAPPVHEHVFPRPEDTELADALREQHERLNEAERELAQIAHDAHDSEERREGEFRQNEEARQQIFLDSELRRDAETRQRSDALFHELEERVASVPPLPVPPHDSDQASTIETIRSATQDAASRHAADIQDIVRMEREEFQREREQVAAERERERAEMAAERQHMDEAREARVRELEEELDRVRDELNNERQSRMTEVEEARAAAAERDEALRNQLAEIATMVQQNNACCEENKAMGEERWAEKQRWKHERDDQTQELLGIVARIVEEQTAARQREEDARIANEGKPGEGGRQLWDLFFAE